MWKQKVQQYQGFQSAVGKKIQVHCGKRSQKVGQKILWQKQGDGIFGFLFRNCMSMYSNVSIFWREGLSFQLILGLISLETKVSTWKKEI